MKINDPLTFRSGYVAVVGRPNVGKSTLINAFIGQKIAAVSPKPQTTRLNQLGILTEEDVQIVFVDTPGIHEPKHKLGRGMNATALEALADADVVLWLVDISVSPQDEDVLIAERLARFSPVIQALNKCDQIADQWLIDQRKKEYRALLPVQKQIIISAKAQMALNTLRAEITQLLPIGLPFYPQEQVTDIYERDIAADLIREAALHHLRDEIPHAIAVRMDEYTEREDVGAYIKATIFVERESQKGIVIGRKGSMLKAIGTSARQEIEAMSARKVFLELRVKVRKNWRSDPAFLQQMGYSDLGKK